MLYTLVAQAAQTDFFLNLIVTTLAPNLLVNSGCKYAYSMQTSLTLTQRICTRLTLASSIYPE